jgi:uncharacterized protein (DUF3084 family)
MGLVRRNNPSLNDPPARARSRVAARHVPFHPKTTLGFLCLCGVALIAALGVVLVLNTNVINGSYESLRLSTQLRHVRQDIQSKEDEIRRIQAELPRRANELGLVTTTGTQVVDITRYVAGLTDTFVGSMTTRGQ